LHHVKRGKVEEHALAVNKTNLADCTPKHAWTGHNKAHKHGPNCGHPAVPHGDHVDTWSTATSITPTATTATITDR
jgi:hypothetical protein